MASWVSPRRLESVATPPRSWVEKIRPARPRAAWLWLVWSARVVLPDSMVPVKKCSSATRGILSRRRDADLPQVAVGVGERAGITPRLLLRRARHLAAGGRDPRQQVVD